MKRQVTWTSALVQRGKRLLRRIELPAGAVEPVDHHLVAAQIRGVRKSVSAVQFYAVRVCALLLLSWTRTFVLFHVACRTKRAISQDWQHGDVPTGVIRDEQILPAAVKTQVTRIGTFRRLLIDESELRVWTDSKRTNTTCSAAVHFAHFVNRVQSVETQSDAKFVFRKYDDLYFLSEFWTAGTNTGREIQVTDHERQLQKALAVAPQVHVLIDRGGK